MIHEIFPVGLLACNCSVLGDEASGDAIVIDPGDDIGHVLKVLEQHSLKLKYIIATHAHIDHVGGIQKLQKAAGAAVLMHAADLPLYENLAMQAEWLGIAPPATVPVDQLLKEGETLTAGSMHVEVLSTPGHSPGSVSLYMPGDEARLFSGDTLFKGSIGRTDLWGGDHRLILRSLHELLSRFPDETPVFPGHGPSTRIGEERESNPFLKGL